MTDDEKLIEAELKELEALVDVFARQMKRKLKEKARAGYSGWNDSEMLDKLYHSFRQHADRELHEETGGQLVDVANLAAMIWNIHDRRDACLAEREDRQ